MEQLTKEAAMYLYENKFWENLTAKEIVALQLMQDRLFMPFFIFQKAITEVLGRPVYTHEFVNRESLIKEFLGEKAPPTIEELIDPLPDKLLIIIRGKYEAKKNNSSSQSGCGD